jgi:Carboxypeptidase regulatory-like domain
MVRRTLLSLVVLAWTSLSFAQAPPAQQPPQQPARDTSAQKAALPTASIVGRVVGAENGRPVKRARILATAPELQGSRAVMTDDSGNFEITALPAGRYTITVSKTGYISLSYGQRRPLQAGTPLQVADGQQIKGIDFSLPRGGAIAGRILDEDGEAMVGASVRVMRYQYMQGDRRLVPVATGMSDDKGNYRVWNLLPGDYYVSATARGAGLLPGIAVLDQVAQAAGRLGGAGGGRGAGANFGGGRGGALATLFGQGQDDQEPVAYAPTFFPGVGSIAEAKAVTVGISQEVLDISFSLQLVRTSRISGHVMSASGTPTYGGTISLTPEGAGTAGRGQIGTTYGGRIDWDGSFTIANVPPGRFTLRATGARDDVPQFAQQPLSVGGDVTDLVVALATGASISGTLSFPSASSPPDPTTIRITAPPADPDGFYANGAGRVDKTGRFAMDGIPSGPRFIRANGARGWTLKSVLIGGRDVIDTPVVVQSGQAIGDITLVFTDKMTQVSGVVTNDQNAPVSEYTVLAFPTDATLWRPQSRQIMTTRPDQNGKYQLRGLPPGEYYMATVDPAVQGEWFEPAFLDQQRPGAIRITLSDGDVKTQDFKVLQR